MKEINTFLEKIGVVVSGCCCIIESEVEDPSFIKSLKTYIWRTFDHQASVNESALFPDVIVELPDLERLKESLAITDKNGRIGILRGILRKINSYKIPELKTVAPFEESDTERHLKNAIYNNNFDEDDNDFNAAVFAYCLNACRSVYYLLDQIKQIADDYNVNMDDLFQTNANDDEFISDKCPIGRDAVGFLFRELRGKGVIKPVTDKELSDSIASLTGYSKEKIRQGKPMTDKAKGELKNLLLSIAEYL